MNRRTLLSLLSTFSVAIVDGFYSKAGSSGAQSEANSTNHATAPTHSSFDIEHFTDPMTGPNIKRDISLMDTIKIVATMADLKRLPVTEKRVVFLEGYYTAGDGGGGIFQGVMTNTHLPNDGTVIVPHDVDASHAWLRTDTDPVNVLWFGAKGDGVEDDTFAIQSAVNYAWGMGKVLYFPSRRYITKLTIPPSSGEYRGDIFKIVGEGAANGFLGEPHIKGSRLVSPDEEPVLTFISRISSSASANHIYIKGIRFEGDSASPVLHLQRFSDFSIIDECEIKQKGTGDGIKFDHAYGGTVQNCHIINNDCIARPGSARTGTAIKVSTSSQFSGGLLTFHKVTTRGFEVGFAIGGAGKPPAPSILSTRIQQCECSTQTNGIILGSGVRKTTIEDCYFEGVDGTCIDDAGTSTTIENCFFMGTASTCFLTAIDSSHATFGNVYKNNEIQLSQSNCAGILLYTDGGAHGRSKVVRDNFIFMNAPHDANNVVGLKLTGTNPTGIIESNVFRPRRLWSSASGTSKIDDQTLGLRTGAIPITDEFNEFQLYSNIALSLAYGGVLTEENISSEVLAIGAGSSYDVHSNDVVSVKRINTKNRNDRILMLRALDTNVTLAKGDYLVMSNNFTGPGTILFNLRFIEGRIYAYEISRAKY